MFDIMDGQILTMLILILAALGILSTVGGIFVLIRKTFSSEITQIAEATAKLGEKGISGDLSGLVGNASNLIDSLNQLSKTASGIGIFLIIMGSLFFVGVAVLIFQG